MSADVDIPKKLTVSPTPDYSLSSILKILITLAIVIYLAEVIAMAIMYYLKVPNYLVETLLDGIIMSVLIIPGLYFLQLKPIWNQMEERSKAEAALRTSEKLMKKILELLPVGMWIVGKDGEVIQTNPAGMELWAGVRYVGIPHYGEYKAWWADTGKLVQPEEWAAARAITSGETILNQELNIEAFDGTHKVILNSAVPIRDEQNLIQGAVVVSQEITPLKRAQRALQESETLFRTAMEHLPVGVWLTEGSGRIIYGNSAGQKIWEGARYVGKEQFGEYRGWWLSTGKLIEPDEWAVARAVDKGETSLNEEIEIECFDGSHKIILNSAVPIRDDQGNILWAFIVNQDITELKERQQALIKTNELLQRFFSCISIHIAYMDRDFNFIRVNDTYAEAAGHDPEFFIGKNHFSLYPHDENESIFREVVETGEAVSVLGKPFEYAEFPERGVTYWDWGLQPVKSPNGEVEGVVLSLVDVTPNKRAQIQLELKNRELEALSKIERKERELAESLVLASIFINKSLEVEEVLRVILEQIRKSINFSGGNIMLKEGDYLRVAGYVGFEDKPYSSPSIGKSYTVNEFPLRKQMIETLQPVKIDSVKENPDWRWIPGLEWIHSYLGVPLVVNKEVLGIISLNSEQEDAFTQEDLDHLMAFASHAALALHNANLFKAELTARQYAETLSEAAQALTKTLELDQVINELLDHIQPLIKSDTAVVSLIEQETQLNVRLMRGFRQQAGKEDITYFPIDEISNPVIMQIIRDRKSFTLSGSAPISIPGDQPDMEKIRNWLIVPMIANDKVIGLVELGKAGGENFDLKLNRWAEALVGQAGVAIQNAWLYQQVRASSEKLQSLARKLVEIQENERYWIARELHDEAGQVLSSLKLRLGRLAQDPECPNTIREKLEGLKDTTDTVLEELHRLAMDLRPIALDHLGLVAALEQFAKNLNSDRLLVQFKAQGFDGDRLPKDVETSLYRIVQEALANVIRHAQACNVGILLERDENMVKLFVEDDGIGFDAQQTESTHRLGLVGMHERAEMFGGTLTIESTPGVGTSIIVEVPYGNSDSHSG
jgi:PAS domain S-box-containing protein